MANFFVTAAYVKDLQNVFNFQNSRRRRGNRVVDAIFEGLRWTLK